ncbi:MAG: hypothetical protein QF360_09065, partial [Phycisphaerales bacterium]|nr:hypothetical protein [Phycisphaerales bacterium]
LTRDRGTREKHEATQLIDRMPNFWIETSDLKSTVDRLMRIVRVNSIRAWGLVEERDDEEAADDWSVGGVR